MEDVKPARTGMVIILFALLAIGFGVLYFVGLIPHMRRSSAWMRRAGRARATARREHGRREAGAGR